MTGTTEAEVLRAALGLLPSSACMVDAEGRIVAHNAQAAALWGAAPAVEARWTGTRRLLRSNGNVLPAEHSALALAVREAREVRDTDLLVERTDGSRVALVAAARPVRDLDGTVIGGLEILTAVPAAADALDLRRLALIVEHSDDAIVSKDLNGTVTTWNRGAERLFGYGAAEMIGRSITVLIPPDRPNEEPAILERLRRGEHVDHYETVRRRKDGSMVDISLTVSPVRDATGRIVGASKIARDIGDRKRAEALQLTLLREAHHRIRNTLATVQAIASRTLRSAREDERAEFIGRLHALAAAHDLLTSETWNRTPLHELVQRTLRPFVADAPDRFEVAGPRDIGLGSRQTVLLAMALHELATNAEKFGALAVPGGTVRVAWEVAGGGPEARVRLRWDERGGPPVERPDHAGFGSTLLEYGLRGEIGARTEFAPGGLACTLDWPAAP